jgi:hypothetical protein
MAHTELTVPDDIWNTLQHSSHPAPIDPSYRILLAALDTGWQVEEPVYLRPRWSGGARVYHFILRLPPLTQPRLITVPEGPEVDRFVHDRDLQVVANR